MLESKTPQFCGFGLEMKHLEPVSVVVAFLAPRSNVLESARVETTDMRINRHGGDTYLSSL